MIPSAWGKPTSAVGSTHDRTGRGCRHCSKKGCRPSRALCRGARKAAGVCHCECYWFPHRAKSGACADGVPVFRKRAA